MSTSRSRGSLGLVGVLLASLCAVVTADAEMAWNAVAPMATPRNSFSMTPLLDGRVLVAGGWNGTSLRSCEIFDPVAGVWSATGQLNGPRNRHAAVRLQDGRVLVVGGDDGMGGKTAEIFDPAKGVWTPTQPRVRTSLSVEPVLLNDGRVFLAGDLASVAEIFDPSSQTWSDTSSMGVTRGGASAILLSSGRVLVAGGFKSGGSHLAAIVYDPSSDTWTPTGPHVIPRFEHSANLLADGRVLLVGGLRSLGTTSSLSEAEIYDPATNAWSSAGTMGASRLYHSATLIAGGKLLVAGGVQYDGAVYSPPLGSVELHDPATGLFSPLPALGQARYLHRATLLPDGTPLVVGGYNAGFLQTAEVFAEAVVDAAPPSVAITAPAVGATLSGTVTLTADASDDSGVVSVAFYADSVYLGIDSTPPYESAWNTAATWGGLRRLVARARDRANKTTDSPTVTVHVQDIVAPTVALTSPSPGATVGDPVLFEATATDSSRVSLVEFMVDDVVVGTDDMGPFTASVSASRFEPGAHTASARASDGFGNSATTERVGFLVPAAGGEESATFDAVLGVPACSGGSACDSDDLLIGRGFVGPEPNFPNTIARLCPDGAAGSFHQDESLDRLRIATLDGSPFAPGKEVQVRATVWAYASGNALDVYYAPDASIPQWSLVKTVITPGPGEHVLTASFMLTAGGARQAIRGVFRFGNTPHPSEPACTAGAFDDHDDLVFALGSASSAATAYDPNLQAPRCLGFGVECDSGGLLLGRSSVGPEPNAPNTTFGECPDGNWGELHVQPSIDRIRVVSAQAGPLARNEAVRVEVTVFASLDYATERLDLFELGYDSRRGWPFWPFWRHLGSVSPSGLGQQVLSLSYTPTDAPLTRAVRAAYRSATVPADSSCWSDVFNDHDDLWFRIDSSADAHALGIDRQGVGGGAIGVTYEGGGSVGQCWLDPSGPPLCDFEIAQGAQLLLTPRAGPGSSFTGWSGACAGTDPCRLSMTEARQVGARFDADTALTLVLDGANGARGMVVTFVNGGGPGLTDECEYPGSSPGDVSCQASYPLGTHVQLFATPANDSVFLGWDGACVGSEPVCQFTITDAVTVRAHFDGPRPLTLVLDGPSGARGRVEMFVNGPGTPVLCEYPGSSPGDVSCQGSYPLGSLVQLYATPANDSVFIGWDGACAGSYPWCQVTITDALTVRAHFDAPRPLTLVLDGANGARGMVEMFVDGPGAPVHCEYPGSSPGDVFCQGSYMLGSLVQIYATPANDSVFLGWDGACAGSSPWCQVTITDALTVRAHFDGPRPLTLVLDGPSGARGMVDAFVNGGGPGTPVHCEFPGSSPGDVFCQGSYPLGSLVQLYATPANDSVFVGWDGACAGSSPWCLVTITDALTVRAHFDGPRPLTLVLDGANGARGMVDMFVNGPGAPVHCEYPGSSPGDIFCQGSYMLGSLVQIYATPANDSVFLGWDGACAGSSPWCQVAITDALTVRAHFDGPRPLTLVLDGPIGARGAVDAVVDGGGSTAPLHCELPGSLDGPVKCQETYRLGTVVHLSLAPDPASVFLGWEGACSGSQPLCTVTMDAAVSVRAVFGLTPAPPVPVVWTSAVGVKVVGNSLTKLAAIGWGNAGAVSVQTLASGDGYVEFTASETNTYKALGLSKGSFSNALQEIDFALMFIGGGRLAVFENGAQKAFSLRYISGDKLRIAVVGSRVQYSKNGVVFYTSTQQPKWPLLVDTSLYHTGATLADAVVLFAPK